MKAFLYSLRYMILIVIGYYLALSPIYKLSFIILTIIPINFLAIKYGINSIPALLVFKNGELTNTSIGYKSKSEILSIL